ncbi:MAG: mechanosensitive ion channel family protein [Candidatus Nanohaloarchaea archaeon]
MMALYSLTGMAASGSGTQAAAKLNFGPKTIGIALAVLVAAWAVNKASNVVIARSIRRERDDPHAIRTAQRLSGYLTFGGAAIVILGVLGVPLSALGTAVGLIGLGLSFALKDIIANFVSGLMILINKPFRIGDQIEIEGEAGTVKDIRVRATDIKTYDGRKMVVPNSSLYSETVINNTAYTRRRFDVVVGIGYDEDIEAAKELAEESLEEAEHVMDDPAPEVLVSELGGSSVNLKLRGWTNPQRADLNEASSEVTQLVKEKYDEAGIDIPFPIRTVFLEE